MNLYFVIAIVLFDSIIIFGFLLILHRRFEIRNRKVDIYTHKEILKKSMLSFLEGVSSRDDEVKCLKDRITTLEITMRPKW